MKQRLGRISVSSRPQRRVVLLVLLVFAAALMSQAEGQAVWTNIYNGPTNGTDSATAIAVGANGDVFVTGVSQDDYATIAYSRDGIPVWTNRYSGAENGYDHPSGIALDNTGRAVVTGHSHTGSYDYVTICYSTAGVPLWTNRYDGPGSGEDWAWAVAADDNGNIFVTGHSKLTDFHLFNYATVAYSASGVPLWTNYYVNPNGGYDSAHALAVDRNGNVFVTGGSSGDYATVGYSNSGIPLWTNRYDSGAVGDEATALALDSSGNVFVTGRANGSDYGTVAYSNDGLPLWTNRYDGPASGQDVVFSVAVDRSGNVFVTGSSSGSTSRTDYATIAYSNSGVALWTNWYNGPGNGWDNAKAVTIDSSGNVIVTGSSVGADGVTGSATICYSCAGIPLWTNWQNGFGTGSAGTAIAADRRGNVFVAGYSAVGGTWDFATIKYLSATPPVLRAARVGLSIVLSWSSACADFILQESPSLHPETWSDVSEVAADDGMTKQVSVPAAATKKFFRLRR